MLTLLQHLYGVLTGDAGLTALVKPSNIGASVRQPTEWPCLEFGILESPRRDPKGHMSVRLGLWFHSTEGATECWTIEPEIHKLMTAENLTDVPNGFRVSRCHRTDSTLTPGLEWSSTLRLEYDLRVVELSPVYQKQ